MIRLLERWSRDYDYDYDEMSPGLTRLILVLYLIAAALWWITGYSAG